MTARTHGPGQGADRPERTVLSDGSDVVGVPGLDDEPANPLETRTCPPAAPTASSCSTRSSPSQVPRLQAIGACVERPDGPGARPRRSCQRPGGGQRSAGDAEDAQGIVHRVDQLLPVGLAHRPDQLRAGCRPPGWRRRTTRRPGTAPANPRPARPAPGPAPSGAEDGRSGPPPRRAPADSAGHHPAAHGQGKSRHHRPIVDALSSVRQVTQAAPANRSAEPADQPDAAVPAIGWDPMYRACGASSATSSWTAPSLRPRRSTGPSARSRRWLAASPGRPSPARRAPPARPTRRPGSARRRSCLSRHSRPRPPHGGCPRSVTSRTPAGAAPPPGPAIRRSGPGPRTHSADGSGSRPKEVMAAERRDAYAHHCRTHRGRGAPRPPPTADVSDAICSRRVDASSGICPSGVRIDRGR